MVIGFTYKWGFEFGVDSREVKLSSTCARMHTHYTANLPLTH